ncbi:hypothetical protein [Agromyces badenianii]|uniref:hypothetical protein n=1 Tax=Agromyces badenianii TaxID=2080742 RepID=UPI000D58DF3E|nr:hypothetical protein [Agromyces badenianii]PWC04189.1 hypothetical protein DCE94_08490 [Agromyces badenianii]
MTPRHQRFLALVALLVPQERRERWMAEWSADLSSCEELGISKRSLLASLAGAAFSLRWSAATSDAAAMWVGADRMRLLVVGVLLPGFAAMLIIAGMNVSQPSDAREVPTQTGLSGHVFHIDPATGAIIGVSEK